MSFKGVSGGMRGFSCLTPTAEGKTLWVVLWSKQKTRPTNLKVKNVENYAPRRVKPEKDE